MSSEEEREKLDSLLDKIIQRIGKKRLLYKKSATQISLPQKNNFHEEVEKLEKIISLLEN